MKKMDEMEMSISLKAMKYAYMYTIIFLFIWSIYNFLDTGVLGLPFILLISQNMILIGTQLFLKEKLSKDEE